MDDEIEIFCHHRKSQLCITLYKLTIYYLYFFEILIICHPPDKDLVNKNNFTANQSAFSVTCLNDQNFLINYSKTQKQNRITKMSVAEGKHVLLIHFFVVFG